MSGIDRRLFLAAVGSSAAPSATSARASVTVDRFGPAQGAPSTVILLHGSDGLTNAARYRLAAQMIADAGHAVLLPRYFEATGDTRARYGDIRLKFPLWREAVEIVLGDPAFGAQHGRVGIVGFSLGGALALALAARSPRIHAVVNFFGFEPAGLRDGRPLPPTLILHGGADRVVPVANAAAIERHIKAQGGTVESHIYPGEGHGLSLASLPDAIARARGFLQRHL
ncbi:dienelactone hydrolase family protein [Bosea sp. BK604]|uniref:dienelactone hydrolase family protein n=1 Tax=Bosea sp. BK604 TaxID=2512180 RepID=UPI0010EE4E56|nr:dienelactone hydrolase family protein [Bosea sp. BK604]TCR68234.1 dienelactone hydrolase family protein [Bosea sp. BK604]